MAPQQLDKGEPASLEVESPRAVELTALLHHALAQPAEAAGEGQRPELGKEVLHAERILHEIVKYLNSYLHHPRAPRQLTRSVQPRKLWNPGASSRGPTAARSRSALSA